MRTFKEFPKGKDNVCPISKTDENKECVLIAIQETIQDNIAEAGIFHLDCIELLYNKEQGVIYQKVE